jgi:hypothetical protein
VREPGVFKFSGGAAREAPKEPQLT